MWMTWPNWDYEHASVGVNVPSASDRLVIKLSNSVLSKMLTKASNDTEIQSIYQRANEMAGAEHIWLLA